MRLSTYFITSVLTISLCTTLALSDERAIGAAYISDSSRIFLEPNTVKVSFFQNTLNEPVLLKSLVFHFFPGSRVQNLKGVIYYAHPETGYPDTLVAVSREIEVGPNQEGWLEVTFDQEVVIEPRDLYLGLSSSFPRASNRISTVKGGEVIAALSNYEKGPVDPFGPGLKIVTDRTLAVYALVEGLERAACDSSGTKHFVFGLIPEQFFSVYRNGNLIFTNLLSTLAGGLSFQCGGRGDYFQIVLQKNFIDHSYFL